MSVAAYVRVSWRSQGDEMQRAAILAAAAPHEIDRWYADTASGGTMDRSGFQAMMLDARRGAFRQLHVFRLDRLTRSGVADTFATVAGLRRLGVALHSVSDHLVILPGDGDVASDVLVFALGLAAQLERTAINDRIAAARARTDTWGRPPRMTAAEVAKAKELRASGRTTRQIAAALGVPRSTLARAIA